MRCHICDAELHIPQSDPHDPKKLLPCNECQEEIAATLDGYKPTIQQAIALEELGIDPGFDEVEDY